MAGASTSGRRSGHVSGSTRSLSSHKTVRHRTEKPDREEGEVEKPEVEELRKIRAAYFGRPHAERAKIIRPRSAFATEARVRTTSEGIRRRKKRSHVSTSTSKHSHRLSQTERRTEGFVYGTELQPRQDFEEDLDHDRATKVRPTATRGSTLERRHSRPKPSRTHSLPSILESEVTPDDSISVVAERRSSQPHRTSLLWGLQSLRRRSTNPSTLDSISERPADGASSTIHRKSSKGDSTLSASGQRRRSAPSLPKPPILVECLTCASDDVPAADSAKLACGHHMCHECLKRLFEMSVKDPAHMPPKCCTDKHIPLEHVANLFNTKFKLLWNRKYQEYKTKNRIYCPAPRCGYWIKPSHIHTQEGRKFAQCPKCRTKVCTLCNNKLHRSQDCPKDPEIAKLVDQMKEKGWQRCFSCNAMVELKEGCNHITCRCTAEFCYKCGSPWKTCECEWFNYTNLANPDRLNEMPEPLQALYRRVFDAARPAPPPPDNAEAMRDRTYAQEMENRRRQERLDADLARRMQLASLFDPDDEPAPRRRAEAEAFGIGNAAGHLMNENYVLNAANVVMGAFGDPQLGQRGESSSGRRRRARPSEQNEGDAGLVPNFLDDGSMLDAGPANGRTRGTN